MSDIVLKGFDELQDAFKAISTIPTSVMKEAVDAMGKAAEDKVRETGRSMGVWDPGNDGDHVLNHVSHSKPKRRQDGHVKAFITFKGVRRRGNTETRNAAIAFFNEFGVEKRGIPARPFIITALARHEDEIQKPAEKIIGDWIEQTYLK